MGRWPTRWCGRQFCFQWVNCIDYFSVKPLTYGRLTVNNLSHMLWITTYLQYSFVRKQILVSKDLNHCKCVVKLELEIWKNLNLFGKKETCQALSRHEWLKRQEMNSSHLTNLTQTTTFLHLSNSFFCRRWKHDDSVSEREK